MKALVGIFASVLLLSNISYAAGKDGASFGVGYILMNNKVDGSVAADGSVGTATEQKTSVMDIKIGYTKSPLFVGGLYSTASVDSKTATVTTSQTRNFFGAVVGYHGNGYFADLSYLFNGKYSQYLSGGDFTEGTGIGLDFGYMANVSGQLNLGVQFSYKTMTFKKYTPVGGTAVSTNWNQTEYYPMLVMNVVF